jgi:hypothetical protein
MADPAPLPLDSLHCVLAYLETERTLHEEANEDRQFDAVYEHVGKLHEWLSGVDNREPGADGPEAHISSEMSAP